MSPTKAEARFDEITEKSIYIVQTWDRYDKGEIYLDEILTQKFADYTPTDLTLRIDNLSKEVPPDPSPLGNIVDAGFAEYATATSYIYDPSCAKIPYEKYVRKVLMDVYNPAVFLNDENLQAAMKSGDQIYVDVTSTKPAFLLYN